MYMRVLVGYPGSLRVLDCKKKHLNFWFSMSVPNPCCRAIMVRCCYYLYSRASSTCADMLCKLVSSCPPGCPSRLALPKPTWPAPLGPLSLAIHIQALPGIQSSSA